YIYKHVPQRKVKSSLSSVIDQAKESVKQQREQAKQDLKKQRRIAWVSIIGAAIAVAALIYGGYQLIVSTISIIDDARERIDLSKKQDARLDEIQKAIESLEQKIQGLKKNRRENINSAFQSQTENTIRKSNGQIKTNPKKGEK
ncbi:MAG: hypothetical protein J7K84_02150, partial [Deltaproteobacteria bacterium]|nr:hypothetical protein [Deltaproteobacteria bacterium]